MRERIRYVRLAQKNTAQGLRGLVNDPAFRDSECRATSLWLEPRARLSDAPLPFTWIPVVDLLRVTAGLSKWISTSGGLDFGGRGRISPFTNGGRGPSMIGRLAIIYTDLSASSQLMNRLLRFALAVGLCVQPAAVHAQATFPTQPPTNPIPGQTPPSIPGIGNPIPPAQSLAPTPSICGAGGEGVRVCNSDFQSCSSICAASVFDPNADTSACAARCCTNLVTCLNIRRCSTSGINCFSLPGTLGITQGGGQ
jgi:hypothetical protein